MAMIYVLFAALLASGANLLMRKNIEYGGTTRGFLVSYFLFTFAASLILYPVGREPWSVPMLTAGGVAGVLNIGLLFFTAKALENGPPGLTFAFQNSCSVLPGILLFALFGPAFNFIVTPYLIAGLFCVLGGLFWSAKSQSTSVGGAKPGVTKKWLLFALGMFLIQGITLTLFQWRCLLIDSSVPAHPLIPVKCSPSEDIWFMPAMFAVASFFQILFFIFTERRLMRLSELITGFIGGLANGGATFFLLLAAKEASAFEKGILFPAFAIGVIVCCNFWGQKLYQERVNWKANALCILGVLLGVAR